MFVPEWRIEVMKAKLLHDVYAAPHWVIPRPVIKAGTIVPIEVATNQPQDKPDSIRYWVWTPELQNDPYGVGLCDGDFELIN